MWGGLEYSLGAYAGFFRTLSGEFCYESGGEICTDLDSNQFEPTPQSNVDDICVVWCTQN